MRLLGIQYETFADGPTSELSGIKKARIGLLASKAGTLLARLAMRLHQISVILLLRVPLAPLPHDLI